MCGHMHMAVNNGAIEEREIGFVVEFQNLELKSRLALKWRVSMWGS